MIPVLGWLVWRRVRRQFGRQPFRPKAQMMRLVLLGLVAAGMVCLAFAQTMFAAAIGIGMGGGASIGVINLKLTRFEWAADGDFYYPHPYVGAALSLLLVGRLLYRAAILEGMSSFISQPPPSVGQSPLTMGLFALLVGYYVAYLAGLMLVRSRHLSNTQ